MAMVSQLKNKLTWLLLLIVRSGMSINRMVSMVEKPAEEICPMEQIILSTG